MKKNTLFYFVLLLLTTFGVQRSYAQLAAVSHRQSPPITVFNDATISVVALFHNLETIHKVNFVYQQELVEGKSVPLPINENDKVETILNNVLPPLNLKFKKLRGGNAYTILPVKSAKMVVEPTEAQKISNNTSKTSPVLAKAPIVVQSKGPSVF